MDLLGQMGHETLQRHSRDHWSIESCHYILDWNWDEDRCRIRTGHGPQNITRLVFDYLRMTVNSRGHPRRNATTAGRTN